MSRVKSIGALAFLALGFSAACTDTYVDPLPRADQLSWPIGLEVHPNGRYLYAVNSNFDTRYNEEVGGTVSVFDLETQKMLVGNGPFIPSFGGQIKLNDDASKAYVAVRYDNQVLALDVAPNGSALGCDISLTDEQSLSSEMDGCRIRKVPNTSNGALMPADPFGLDVLTVQTSRVEVQEADGVWTLTLGSFTTNIDATGLSQAELLATLAQTINEWPGVSAIGSDGFLTVFGDDGNTFDLVLSNPSAATQVFDTKRADVLGVSHLRGTQLTGISLPQQDVASASLRSAEFLAGTNAITRRPGTRDFYAAGRLSRDLAIFQPYLAPESQRVEALIDRGRVTLNHLTTAVDGRAMVFEPDGKTLYVATRNPDALHIVSIAPADPENGTGTAHRIIASIPLERSPSDIVRLQIGSQTRLYIPCFEDGVIQVVDPATRAVVDEIELGASPYVMKVDRGAYCTPGSGRCWGYVSLFDDLAQAGGRCDLNREEPCGSIGVVDLDPESPRYHRLIRKLY